MKSKYACSISFLLLLLLFCAITANCIYTRNTAEKIINGLDDADTDHEKLTELMDYWEERRLILDLSHSEPELDRISFLFEELMIYAESENEDEYKRTAACLKHAVANIKEIEEFSIKNIF